MRSPEMMKNYFNHTEMRKKNPPEYPAFEGPDEEIIADFKYWFIVKNNFPYDSIAETHHMIVSKRKFALDWDLVNKEEMDELSRLKKTGYIFKNYDVFLENLPTGQTVPGRFHIHLIKLIRFEI